MISRSLLSVATPYRKCLQSWLLRNFVIPDPYSQGDPASTTTAHSKWSRAKRNLSKASSVVFLYCKFSSGLAFERFYFFISLLNLPCKITMELIFEKFHGDPFRQQQVWRSIVEWVMLHIWTRRVAHMSESCRIYEWVVLHIWVSHVTYMNESCRTYDCAFMYMDESCRTYECAFMYMDESCRTYECAFMSMNESCRTYECAFMYMNESCRIYKCVVSHTWLSHVAYMNESCHTYGWVMSRICIKMKVMSRAWMRPGTYERVVSHTWVSHVEYISKSWCVAHMRESYRTFERVMSYV